MGTQNVQTRVCSIAELVESILHQADMSPLDLLLARRINKTFNDVIIHSLPFRRALFLEPNPDGMELDIDPSKVEVNPFLRKIFPQATKDYFDLALDPIKRKHFLLVGHEVLVCQGKLCKVGNSNRVRLAYLDDNRCFVHLPRLDTNDEEDYFTRAQWYEHALWRKMYATRPNLSTHVVWKSPIYHQYDIVHEATLGEIVSAVVTGQVVFSTPEHK
ncbi:hypothetical protein P171DRAFT_432007 [Karstenula rhodostoma CBS 690.94]|uniref:F-box domain-containing protein n=1 Tax=Karstenula rhodostoma CBS 690.94 TaxID=1392251 RepID=A0A9P4UCM2_9PLEO|nr:hypothetical protein P171DRAFT_432007 [Karstenula rhodostoma CBS 690.94]